MSDPHASETDLLLRRAATGDSRAQAEVLARYRSRLKRMIAIRIDRRVAARIDPSDVVQEALKTAHQRLPEYLADPQVPIYPWLRRIAWDRLVDVYRTHIRAERRSVLREQPWRPEVNEESVSELAHCVASTSILPSRRAMLAELEARMAMAMGHLRPPDREILVLRYLEQLGAGEIADILGISHTAVTSRHLRALKRLRRLLRNDRGDSSI